MKHVVSVSIHFLLTDQLKLRRRQYNFDTILESFVHTDCRDLWARPNPRFLCLLASRDRCLR
jgi:hypothetical protein